MATILPVLSQQQQKAAAAICLGAIVVIVAAMLLLFANILAGGLSGNRWPGLGLMLLMENSNILVAGKSIPLILSFGAAALVQSKLRDAVFFAIIALCVAGIILSLLLTVLLSAPSIANEMFNNAPSVALADSTSYYAAVARFFVPLTIWLVGMLAIQLGIKLASSSGDSK